jgi:hypothetical protein
MIASFHGNLNMVTALLKCGAHVDAHTRAPVTKSFVACMMILYLVPVRVNSTAMKSPVTLTEARARWRWRVEQATKVSRRLC